MNHSQQTERPGDGKTAPGRASALLIVAGAALVLGAGGWLVKGELDRRAEEAARQAEITRTGIAHWVSIPGGSYEMGSAEGPASTQPVHSVTIAAFELMKTEVTVGQYRKCVDAGACTTPEGVFLGGYQAARETEDQASPYCNWEHPEREDQPVNCVDWDQAQAFAKWAGGRLPTESEWEYAARSGGNTQPYPWGDEAPSCSRAVFDDGAFGCGEFQTWPVCSKPAGNSAQGVCDLAGNVKEWTQDDFHDSYVGAPADGSAWEGEPVLKVRRGGGWGDPDLLLNASGRHAYLRGYRGLDVGFRLVMAVDTGASATDDQLDPD